MARRPRSFGVGSVRVRVRGSRGYRPGGVWYWVAERYVDGKARSVWSGWATREVAERMVAGIVATGVQAQRCRHVEVKDVHDLCELYLGDREERVQAGELAAVTFRNQVSRFRALLDALGGVRLERLTLPVMESFVTRRARAGAGVGTVRLELQCIGAAWSWGRARGLTPDRDLPRARPAGAPERAKHTPAPAEMLQVLDHLEGWPRLVFILLWGTGARVGEVATIEWADIDLDSTPGRLVIRGEVAKTSASRVVPLGPDVVAELRAWGPGEPYERVVPVAVNTVRSSFGPRHLRHACRDAGVRRFSPHALRSAVVDSLARSGVDIATASRLTGHSPAVMMNHYRRVTDADVVDAVARAGLGKLPGGDVVQGPWAQRDG